MVYRIAEKFGEIGEFGEITSHSPIKTHQIFKDSHVIYRVVPRVSPRVSTTERLLLQLTHATSGSVVY